ncbi:MAG: TrkA family potassium uptake protein [Clostridiales bacterium]|jgi:trk system potassium uptake protein TrkA|nr:TrkA family potassium uptake protein [Clostridiales bacterium]
MKGRGRIVAFSKNIMEFGIIGLGRFGFALAKSLAEAGKDVMVVDNNENKIKNIRNYVDNAFVVGTLDQETLMDAGIQNCDTVIVCIGESIEVSILTTLFVINIGVPRVISKATSTEHGIILDKIGAEVIYPERDMAIRLAHRLTNPSILETMELTGDISISELKLTSKIAGKTILQANLRQKYKLNIIALEREGNTIIELTPDMVMEENDNMVVIGKKDNINKFEMFLMGGR